MAPSPNTGDCLRRARKSEAISSLRIQEQGRLAHLQHSNLKRQASGTYFGTLPEPRSSQSEPASSRRKSGYGSVIIHDFTNKSSFFMSLGARSLKRTCLVFLVG